ncbi:cytochrome C biogenesis protein [Roseomonas sp. M0104]|uniref:Cytochrome C biogenesis protein n=2 Tax=Teichococcus coralli TaxID=2545983 RepID=A0A845B7R0_9PROT|nr:cytochrome C biogenesis protein [Pseudoroseomonas coralli]
MTLAAEVDAVAPGQSFRLGLRQVLAPGWHTYWRNAGDAGAPPEISFTAPDGTKTTGFDWPAPQRIPFGPLVNYGYEGHVLLPLTVTPPASLKPGDVFTLEAQANWLVCEQVCVPEEGSFRLDFPAEAAPRPDPALAEAFREAEAALPRPSPWKASLGFDGQKGALRLDGTDLTPATIRAAGFFPAAPTVLNHAAPQPMTASDGALRLGLERGAVPLPPGPVEGVVVLTDAAGGRSAFSISATPGAVPTALAASASAGPGLWQAALLAALGGLILNLMPCVFPILAMKAMALARLSGAARGEVRGHAASYTAGVLLCFLALAGLLLALRAGGVVAGWGFQFTAPAFVAGMSWLMLAVGLNLAGVFQVGGAVGAGAGLAARGGHLGSFATGGLAVLVATPCTAPFMATAIGAALSMPPAATLAIFAAMGLGMAAPYALLALAPGLARLLPRPGTWMERLKELLAFPMFGAALWLLWVLAQQVGPEGLAAALAGALAVGFAAWAWGTAQRARTPRGRWLGRAGGTLALLAALAALPGLAAAPAARPGALAAAGNGAEPWSAARLAALRAEGRPVFVNLTAAWCITCKVNERVALDTEAVRAAFARQGVAYLKGDWTDGNATLAAVLRAHGRAGVPLYLLYPPGGGEPAVLPQILTEGIMLRALGADPA